MTAEMGPLQVSDSQRPVELGASGTVQAMLGAPTSHFCKPQVGGDAGFSARERLPAGSAHPSARCGNHIDSSTCALHVFTSFRIPESAGFHR